MFLAKRSLLPALVLLAACSSFVAAVAQSDRSEFDQKRRELRQRWVTAQSSEEKAIENTVEAIEINRGMVDYNVEKLKVAQFLEKAPHFKKK